MMRLLTALLLLLCGLTGGVEPATRGSVRIGLLSARTGSVRPQGPVIEGPVVEVDYGHGETWPQWLQRIADEFALPPQA